MNRTPERISNWQLLALIVTFEAGSSIVVGIGNEAKQDIWIAMILAALIGTGLVYLFHLLLARRDGDDLFQIMEGLLGKLAGRALIMVYVFYFLYASSIVIRDFVELISTTILIETPRKVVAFTLVLLIVYILRLGLEVLARTTEIFLPYLIGSLLLIFVLLFASESMHTKFLRPVLADGWGPVLKAVFPGVLGFPFGEVVVFMLIMGSSSRFRHAGKAGVIALLFSGAMLTLTNAVQIMTLGADGKMRSHFPLMTAARSISIANFIERIDALVVFITMVGIVVKAGVFLYGATRGIERVFGVPYRSIVLPAGMIVSVFSILMGGSFKDYEFEVMSVLTPFLEMPLQVGIPLLLLLLVVWKQRKRSRKQEGRQHENNR